MAPIEVFILRPDHTVETMQDEIRDGLVTEAVDLAREQYGHLGHVSIVDYDEDFDNAIDLSVELGATCTALFVIISDLQGNALKRAGEHLAQLTDDFVMVIAVSNQGYNAVWAEWLDDRSAKKDQIGVLTLDQLSDPTQALREVGPWSQNLAA